LHDQIRLALEPFIGVRIRRLGDFQMAKKRISSADLSWLILEELKTEGDGPSYITLAVVADPKDGWRAVVGRRSQRSISPEGARRLAAVQKRLRLVYELADG
jgi:hypothetical protein